MQPQTDRSHVSLWLYWLSLPLRLLVLKLYFRAIVVTGQEHLPTQGPAIFAVKHYSRWDPMVVALLSREPMRFMTNANQFGGIQGWFIKRLGAYPMDIARPQLASLRHTIELLRQGQKLVIFPEGGIVRDQPLRSLKPGLARLVLQAEAKTASPIPIVPITLRYDPEAQFRSTVLVHIGPPIYSVQVPTGQPKQTAAQLTQILQSAMLQGLEVGLETTAGQEKNPSQSWG